MPDNKKKIYDALSVKYPLGDYNTFTEKIKDETNLEKLYTAAIKEKLPVGDYNTFKSKIMGSYSQTDSVTASDIMKNATPVKNVPYTERTVSGTIGQDLELGFLNTPEQKLRYLAKEYGPQNVQEIGGRIHIRKNPKEAFKPFSEGIASAIPSLSLEALLPAAGALLTGPAAILASGGLGATGTMLKNAIGNKIEPEQGFDVNELVKRGAVSGAISAGGEGAFRLASLPFKGIVNKEAQAFAKANAIPYSTGEVLNSTFMGNAFKALEKGTEKIITGNPAFRTMKEKRIPIINELIEKEVNKIAKIEDPVTLKNTIVKAIDKKKNVYSPVFTDLQDMKNNMVKTQLDKIGELKDPSVLKKEVVSAIEDKMDLEKNPFGEAYKNLDNLAKKNIAAGKNITLATNSKNAVYAKEKKVSSAVNMKELKDWSKKVLEDISSGYEDPSLIGKSFGIGSSTPSQIYQQLQRFAGLEDNITFKKAMELTSDLKAAMRADKSPLKNKLTFVQKQGEDLFDNAMERASKDSGVFEEYKTISNNYRKYMEKYGSENIQSLLGEGANPVNDFSNLISANNIEQIREVKNILPAKSFQSLKRANVQDMINKATIVNKDGITVVNGNKIKNEFMKLGEEVQKEVYTPQERSYINSIGELHSETPEAVMEGLSKEMKVFDKYDKMSKIKQRYEKYYENELIKRLVKEDTPLKSFTDVISRGKIENIRTIKSILPKTKWQELKRAKLEDLLEKATHYDKDAVRIFSPKKLLNNFKELSDPVLNELLDQQEKKALLRLTTMLAKFDNTPVTPFGHGFWQALGGAGLAGAGGAMGGLTGAAGLLGTGVMGPLVVSKILTAEPGKIIPKLITSHKGRVILANIGRLMGKGATRATVNAIIKDIKILERQENPRELKRRREDLQYTKQNSNSTDGALNTEEEQ